MRIAAHDLGTRSGWALSADFTLRSGMKEFPPGMRPGSRYLSFYSWLKGLHEPLKPEVVVYERLTFLNQSTAASHVYYGFLVSLEMRCAASDTRLISFPTWAIKQLATGKGNAKKDAMVKAAVRQFGDRVNVTDDNQADALWLLEAARMVLAGELTYPIKREQLAQIRANAGASA